MGEDEEKQDGLQNIPFPPPPPPPGINLPPPPPLGVETEVPPPPPPGIVLPPPPMPDPVIEAAVGSDISSFEEEEAESSHDFNSHWQKRKANDPNLSVGNRESMYGHIDRIAVGEVGTLLDRFSDRFGSELDREIIVLRKKQQQEMREIKPTVELIQAPASEYEIEEDDEEQTEVEEYTEVEEEGDVVSDDDEFADFFSIVNDLLGNMPDDFVNDFISSPDFALFQEVGADPGGIDEDIKSQFFIMINSVLGKLPEAEVTNFINSPDFALYQRIGEIYGE